MRFERIERHMRHVGAGACFDGHEAARELGVGVTECAFGIDAEAVSYTHLDVYKRQRLSRDLDARVEEAKGLAVAIGLKVVAAHPLRLRQTRAATLIGVGQIEAIKPAIAAHDVQLVIVDAALTAIQQRNLETAFGTKVIDLSLIHI